MTHHSGGPGTPTGLVRRYFFRAIDRFLPAETRGLRDLDREYASARKIAEQTLALLLIRAYRALFVLVGGDPAQMRHWWHTSNRHLDGAPVELIRNVQGLLRVVEYLDAMRGKL